MAKKKRKARLAPAKPTPVDLAAPPAVPDARRLPPYEVWQQVDSFLAQHKRCEDRDTDLQSAIDRTKLPRVRQFLCTEYERVFGVVAPAVTNTHLLLALTYELQVRGFKEHGAADLLANDTLHNHQRALAFDIAGMTPRVKCLYTLQLGAEEEGKTSVQVALDNGRAFKLTDYAIKTSGGWSCRGCEYTAPIKVACAMVSHVKSCGGLDHVAIAAASDSRIGDAPKHAADKKASMAGSSNLRSGDGAKAARATVQRSRGAAESGKVSAFRLTDHAIRSSAEWTCKRCDFKSPLRVACAMVSHVKKCTAPLPTQEVEQSIISPKRIAKRNKREMTARTKAELRRIKKATPKKIRK